jgi:hypothetical protein
MPKKCDDADTTLSAASRSRLDNVGKFFVKQESTILKFELLAKKRGACRKRIGDCGLNGWCSPHDPHRTTKLSASGDEFLRRTFLSITLNKKRIALAGAATRRKERKRFCAFAAR